jgi:hypothetical protein
MDDELINTFLVEDGRLIVLALILSTEWLLKDVYEPLRGASFKLLP